MDYGAIPAHLRRLARRTVHGLPGVLLVLLLAVADATPLEPLHLKGIQDGGDYDSLIQPLVLTLGGLADAPVPVLTPLGPSPARVTPAVPADLPVPASQAAESRAPPVP